MHVITVPYFETTSDSRGVFNNLTTHVTVLLYSRKQFRIALKKLRLIHFIVWKNILLINSYKVLSFLILSITIHGF